MGSSIIPGILLIASGAFISGSFTIPFGKIKKWQWESLWMVYSLGAYIIFPVISSMVFVPDIVSIIRSTSFSTILIIFFLGAVYGIGNLSFGLSLRYLGLTLGYALSLGLMMALGTLIPPLLNGKLKILMQNAGGSILIKGILVACIGVAVSAWSGILEDKSLSNDKKRAVVGEYNLQKGILAAMLVGLAGSAMSLGFEQGGGTDI
ncbi:MAG: hypothetical protein HC906_04605 [Bacteroidales bacterium]|nr:hypothetical protein [Bacteroidales bacterium]